MAAIDTARTEKLRRDLARKGMEVNEKLTRMLAAQNATLTTMKLPSEEEPGLKPHEKLRRYLDQIVRAQKRLGTGAWGACMHCAAELAEAALDDAPWLELCAKCAADES